MKNHYAILDLPQTVTPEQLHNRYKQLTRIYHLDRFSNSTDKAYAEERLKAITEAYAAIGATVQHRRPPILGKRSTVSLSKVTPTPAPTTAPPPIPPKGWLRRRFQSVAIVSSLILAGLAAPPLFSSIPHSLHQLWRMTPAAAGRAEQTLPHPATGTQQAPVDWVPVSSPSGQQLVFILRQDGIEKLYIRNQSNGRLQAVLDDSVDSASFVWSPDEKKLAFLTYNHGANRLHILNLQTALTEQVAESVEMNQLRTLHWAADSVFAQ